MSTIEIRVLFFASAREKVGVGSVQITLPISACLNDLAQVLYQEYPQLSVLKPYLRWAVNQKFEENDQSPLKQGDEVALIPPISGG